MKCLLTFLFSLFFFSALKAQPDSLQVIRSDSSPVVTGAPYVFEELSPVRKDTFIAPRVDLGSIENSKFRNHPFFKVENPTRYTISVRRWEGKEGVFYSLIALLLFFALIRNGFFRYIQDLFSSFFQTSPRQRQIREQLMQSPLPSLLLNVFFLLSTGMFIALAFKAFGLATRFSFWILFLYAVGGLMIIYGVKWIVLKIMGWVLQASDAIDSYIFVVFTTNKILGVALLPIVIAGAFSNGDFNQVVLTLGVGLIILFFVYRFYLSFVSLHQKVAIQPLHFLIYLAALEVAPLLLINKLLFTYLI